MIVRLCAATALLPLSAGAADPNAPIVIRFPETMQSGTGAASGVGYGVAGALLGAWVDSARDKRSAPQVVAFREATARVDFIDATQQSLKCLGVPEPRTACRELLTLPAVEGGELPAHLIASGVTELIIVNVVPLLTDERLHVRAFVQEMAVGPKRLSSTRVYGVIYDSRAPKALIDAENPDDLKAFWREGEPSRIERESLAAAQDIERALSFLSDHVNGLETRPEFAKALPKIDELEESGRIDCGAAGCSTRFGVHVVPEDGPRTWLTSNGTYGSGPVIVSLDENSLTRSTNVGVYVVRPD